MVDPGGREEDRLGGRTKPGHVPREEDFAQNFRARRAARLAGANRLYSRLPKVAQKMADLSRFASPFAALECNEGTSLTDSTKV
jgi:hypothetical protein